MTGLFEFQFSGVFVVVAVLIGVLLSLLMRLLRRFFIKRISKNRQWYQVGELTVWLLYCGWALRIVLGDTLYYKLALLLIFLVIFVWISWFVIRDFIAGTILKISDTFHPGQYFKLGGTEGIIQAVDYLQLELRHEDGNVIKIPYHKIIGDIHLKGEIEDQRMVCSFEIVPNGNLTDEEIRQMVHRTVLQSTGVRTDAVPRIIPKGGENNQQRYEIVIPVLNPNYNILIERNIREVFK